MPGRPWGSLARSPSGSAARPLLDEIDRLARLARFELAADGDGEAASDAGPSAADAIGLTEREVEVLRLIAAGWTNQEIADALFISRKTASVHASHIFDKLGAANRSEAGAIAHRLGLAADVPPPPGSGGQPEPSRRRLVGAALELVEARVGDPEVVRDLVVDGVGHPVGERRAIRVTRGRAGRGTG